MENTNPEKNNDLVLNENPNEDTNENKIKLGYLKDICIRKLESIIPLIANENVYDSNLINDIAYVDYTENSKGYTSLQPLEGLPLFIDDLYIYKYIHMDDIERIGERGVKLITGENKAASNTVKKFEAITNEVFGEWCPQKITHTVRIIDGIFYSIDKTDNFSSSILKTILFINSNRYKEGYDDNALKGYYEYYGKSEENKPVAVIKYKIDTSKLPSEVVLKNLTDFQKRINQLGAGLFSTDYTRDFSGVIELNELKEFFFL